MTVQISRDANKLLVANSDTGLQYFQRLNLFREDYEMIEESIGNLDMHLSAQRGRHQVVEVVDLSRLITRYGYDTAQYLVEPLRAKINGTDGWHAETVRIAGWGKGHQWVCAVESRRR